MTDTAFPNHQQYPSVLVLAPAMSTASIEACVDLPTLDESDPLWVLAVSYTSAERWLHQWDGYTSGRRARLGLIRIDNQQQPAETPAEATWTRSPTPETVSMVRPSDLTGLGILFDEYLQSWTARNEDGDTELHVCFDSVTALLQYASLETTFRFLRVLISHLHAVEASAHFHLDPGAHTDQAVATLSQIFDGVVEATYTGGGLSDQW